MSSETFTALDNYVWKLVYKWAKHSHPNKPKHWIVDRYFGRFNHARQDRWVFGDRDSGAYLLKFSWTKIVRHQLVKGTASPDDPALGTYWAQRRQRKRARLPVDKTTLHLLQKQDGRCPLCRSLLLHADHQPQTPNEWEQWLRTTRKAITKQHIVYRDGGTPGDLQLRLTHAHCLRRLQAAEGSTPALLPAYEP